MRPIIIDRISNLSIIKDCFWRKMIKNIIIAITGQGGTSLINIINLFIMITILGPNQYGLFTLAQSYMSVIDSIINFQSWQGGIKFGIESLEEKDNSKFAAVIKAGFLIDFISAIIGCMIAIVLSPLLRNLFGWDPEILFCMILFSVEIMFHINGTPTAILRILQKFNLVAIHSISCALVRLIILVLYFTLSEVNLYGVTVVYVIVDIFTYITLFLLAIRALKKELSLKQIILAPLKKLDKEYYSYTIWSNLTVTCDIPIKYFDVFFLSTISVEIVAIYKFFKQILQIFGLLVNPISQVIMPQLGELVAKDEKVRAYAIVNKMRDTILYMLIPLSIIILLIAPFIFNKFLSSVYYDNYLIFVMLLFLNIFTLSYIALHPYFSIMGFAKESTKIILFSNIIYVILAFILINLIGVYGIILASAIQFSIVIYLKIKIINKKLLLN